MLKKTNILKFVLLWPLSFLYGIGVGIRNFCYDHNIFKHHTYNIPIISIGNISVGGTGKTPHTEFLIQKLKEEFNIAVLSRGYKRKTKGFRIVKTTDKHFDSGDEPLQIKNKFPNIIVAVSENRAKGIEQLKKMYPNLNLIILDDAFQHRKVKPGLSILLNNYHHPIASDHLLPLGYLRENHSASHRAHVIIYSKCPESLKPIERRILSKQLDVRPFQYLFFSTLEYQDLSPVFDDNKKIELNELKNFNVLAISGIAKSKSFVDFIKSNSKNMIHLKFRDHHNFNAKDIKKIEKNFNNITDEKIIIVTEKDAIRLKSINLFNDEIKKYIYCVPIKVKLLCDKEEEKQFDNQIFSYVRNNKRYSKLYKNKY